jgi:NitT/TauT family transport system permease protein
MQKDKTLRRSSRQASNTAQHLPLYLLSLGLGLLLWQAARLTLNDTTRRFLLPTPLQVIRRFFTLIQSGALLHHLGVTLTEMGLGLALGTGTALLLGYAVAHSKFLAHLLEPVIVTSQAVPIVALAPLLTIWFGPGLTSKVVVCALIVFFPILVNVIAGLEAIDPRLDALFDLLEATRWQRFRKLEVPAALPHFLTGLRVGGTLAAMGAVVGEFVASSEGLGYLVKQGQNLYDTALMFVAILTLTIVALSVYGILRFIERQALHWQHVG